MGYRGCWYKPSGPSTTKVRAVFVFSAQNETHSQWPENGGLLLPGWERVAAPSGVEVE